MDSATSYLIGAIIVSALGAAAAAVFDALLRRRERAYGAPSRLEVVRPREERSTVVRRADLSTTGNLPAIPSRLGELTEISGHDGQRWILERPETIIGRSPRADVVLESPDREISRAHARITMRGARWFLADLASINGTWLNGRPLVENAPAELHDGDIITLAGRTELRFHTIDVGREEPDSY